MGLNPPLELGRIDEGLLNGLPLKLLLMGSLLSEFLAPGFGLVDDAGEEEEGLLVTVAIVKLDLWAGSVSKIWKENGGVCKIRKENERF